MGWGTAMLLLGALAWMAVTPSTTRQAVGPELTIRQIPLYVKVLEFASRHYRYGKLAREITGAASTDAERARAVFDWTRTHIRRSPSDWPVLDDHILNVIVRGHGAEYQIAEVFSTLATYAGMPSFFQWAVPRGLDRAAPLCFVRIQNRWVVFDVVNGVVFRDGGGRLREAQDLVPEVELPPARPLQAELQMPRPRLLYETRQAVTGLLTGIR
jgi:hypothetical protein